MTISFIGQWSSRPPMSITIFKYPWLFHVTCYLLDQLGGITVLNEVGNTKWGLSNTKTVVEGVNYKKYLDFFYCLAYFRAYLVLFCVILRHLEDPSHLVENHRYRLLLLTGAWKPLVNCAAWNFLLCFLDNESHMILERYEGAFHLGWTVL